MLGQILNLAEKEFIQVWRDKVLMAFLVLGPVLQFLLLAQSTGGDVRNIAMAVVDYDNSELSRQIVRVLDNTRDLNLRYYLENRAQLDKLLDEGKVKLGIVFPPRFAAHLAAGDGAQVQVLADGTNFIEGSAALRVAQGALVDFLERNARGPDSQLGGIGLRTTIEFNPAMSVRLHTIPAELSFIVFQISILVAALSFARERELSTLEQLQITPLGQVELLLGKAVLAMVVGLANFAMVFALSMVVFGVPMRGSLADLLLLTTLFVAANVAMGMIISVLSSTQQQALLLVFLICVLEVNVSGYLLSVNNMPAPLQVVAEFSPLRHYISIVRDIMLKGTTLTMLVRHAVSLILLTIGCGAIVWRLLRRYGN